MFNLPDSEDETEALDIERYYYSLPPKLPEGLQAGCLQADCKLSTGHTYLDEAWYVSDGQVRRAPKESVDVFNTI